MQQSRAESHTADASQSLWYIKEGRVLLGSALRYSGYCIFYNLMFCYLLSASRIQIAMRFQDSSSNISPMPQPSAWMRDAGIL